MSAIDEWKHAVTSEAELIGEMLRKHARGFWTRMRPRVAPTATRDKQYRAAPQSPGQLQAAGA